MIKYPALYINKENISNNSKIIKSLCDERNIKVVAVIKGFNGIESIVESFINSGFDQIASSRLEHLRYVKQHWSNMETLSLRIPMISEIKELIKWSDISLNSELDTLIRIDAEARNQNKIHKTILMRDLGDLREGIFDRKEFINTAVYIEKNLKNTYLYGVGTNLTCYGSIIPTYENLSELSDNAIEIEKEIGRKLDVVSGGSTSSLPLVYRNEMPDKINQLRIGEAIVVPYDLINNWKCDIEGLSNDSFILKAEIIETSTKPTYPIGILGRNCFGKIGNYEDDGVRRRAILAMGNFDVGDCMTLVPKDKNIKILGASSDHTIIDIENCVNKYSVGDIVEFNIRYQSMLFSTNCYSVYKLIV